MSLPAHADSVVNCSPVSCIPSPESPAKRITARSSSRRVLAPFTGAAVSLIDPLVSRLVTYVVPVRCPGGIRGGRPRLRQGVLHVNEGQRIRQGLFGG